MVSKKPLRFLRKLYSDSSVQKSESKVTEILPNFSKERLQKGSIALQIAANSQPGISSKTPKTKSEHSQDEQTFNPSSGTNVDPKGKETEENREVDPAVHPLIPADHVSPEAVHAESAKDQPTSPLSTTPWTPETHSQQLWTIAYNLLKNEKPDVVGKFELDVSSYCRATTDAKHGYVLGRLSALIRSGSSTSRTQIAPRSALMKDFLDKFLSRPDPIETPDLRRPGELNSGTQISDDISSEADEPLTDNLETLGAKLKELIQRSQYAFIPWVASILALRGFLRLLTSSERIEIQSTVIPVICKMQWYIDISRQFFRPGEQTHEGSDEGDQEEAALINLYKAILSHQIHAALCAYDKFDNRSPECKDFGQSDLIHFEQNIRLQEETLVNFNTKAVKAEISAIMSSTSVLQKKQDTESEDFETAVPVHDKTQIEKLLQAIHVPKQPIIDPQDAKNCHFIKLYRWLQETTEFTKFACWENKLEGRVLWLDGDFDMGKTELLQLACHGLSEPQAEGTSGSLVPKHVAWYFYDSNKFHHSNLLSVVNCLIYQVLESQPLMSKHLMTAYDDLNASGPDGLRSFYILSLVLYSILRDPEFQPTYFITHVLHGSSATLLPPEQMVYDRDHEDLLSLIYTTVKVSDRVRWLVSFPNGQEKPDFVDTAPHLRVTLNFNTEVARKTVANYTASSLVDIAKTKGNQESLQAMVMEKMKASSAFEPLWFNTALDIVRLDETYWNAPEKLKQLMEDAPNEGALSSLYSMVQQKLDVLMENDREYCLKMLSVSAIVYRPLLSTELKELVSLPSSVSLTVLIERFLSPFLRLCDDEVSEKQHVCFVHQSAKRFILHNLKNSQISKQHSELTKRCLDVLVQRLSGGHPASSTTDDDQGDVSFNMYAVLYWMRHISKVAEVDEDSVDSANRFMREYRVQWLKVFASHGSLRDAIAIAIYSTQLSMILCYPSHEIQEGSCLNYGISISCHF